MNKERRIRSPEKSAKMVFGRTVICETCRGKAVKSGKICGACAGKGVKQLDLDDRTA